MATLNISDDCLSPERYVYLTYSGPDPWGVVKKITGNLKAFFHIATSDMSNERLNWDATGDPINFYSLWWAKKGMSGFTQAKWYFWVQGSKSKTDNTGHFTMRLNGDLETTFNGPGIILKPYWVIYSFLFYNRVRRRQLERCRDFLLAFRNEIKEHYNLGVTPVHQTHISSGPIT